METNPAEQPAAGNVDPDWKPEPKKRKKRRFHTAKELEEAIDEAKRHAAKILMESEILNRFAEVLRDFPKWFGQGDAKVLTLDQYRELAAKMERKSVNITNVKCKKLSKALAEIRTEPLLTVTVRPDGEPDNSVQLS